MLYHIAKIHFDLSQQKFIWFPFYVLKPQSDQEISHRRTATMAIFFGAYFYLIYLFKNLVFSQWSLSLSVLPQAIIGFYIWFEIVTRPLWNYYLKRRLHK